MESIRRKIKIFWLEHSDPIIFYTLIIGGVILIVQFLNQLAIEQEKNNGKEYSKNSVIEKSNNYFEEEKNTELIEEFITYCKDAEIEAAYKLLSEKCKKECYPTIEDFTTKYYNIMFKQSYDIEIKYNATNNLYDIYFYEDILKSGKVENRSYIQDIYKIEESTQRNKTIYINTNNKIK